MSKIKIGGIVLGLAVAGCFGVPLYGQSQAESNRTLSIKQQSIIPIAAYTATGDPEHLKTALNKGLDAGLTVNEIKEIMVHLYAYCGFPRSIRGLQTVMEVLEERKARGIQDELGRDASPVSNEQSKYERGKKNLRIFWDYAQKMWPLRGSCN